MSRALLATLPGNETLGARLAAELTAETADLELRSFPDGEAYLRWRTSPEGRHVVLLCTLDHPDGKVLSLIFAAAAARDLGAASVGLVCPYLGYMRQDRRFQPGERTRKASSGSRRWPGALMLPTPCCARSAAVIGTSRSVSPISSAGREHTPVLVDDIVSTGRTMIATLHHLARSQTPPPTCIAIHGIFAGEAHRELLDAGAIRVATCNTIPHESNAIDVSVALAHAASVAIKKP